VISKIAVSTSKNLLDSIKYVASIIPIFEAALLNFNIPLIDIPSLEEFIVKCANEFTRGNREELARLDSLDFILPNEVYNRDIGELIEVGSLANLARSRHDANTASRFNIDRCNAVFGDFPCEDLDRLRLLATEGSQILVPENFVRQPTPAPMRALASRLGNTYSKHAYKLFKSGNVLLFRLSDIPPDTFSILNFGNNAHWTVKPDDVMGRLLTDPNHPSPGFSGLNTDESFTRAQEIYGKMSLPSILNFISDALAYADQNSYPLSDLRIYKEDIKGAFAHSKINPDCVWLSAMLMTADLVMVYLYGYFGYHAQPLIFAVFSRMFSRVFKVILLGIITIYVDDFIGVAHFSHAAADQLRVQLLILQLLGDKGLAPDNTLPTSSADIIGWRVDFALATVRPNDKGIRKMFFVFFVLVDSDQAYWPLNHVQIVASLAERYSVAIIGMRAFVDPFNKLLTPKAALASSLSKRKISAAAKFSLLVWRAVILIIKLDPDALLVPLRNLVFDKNLRADYTFISDAADSIGLAIYDKHSNLVLTTSYKLPFSAHEGKFQNAREFMGFLLALILIKVQFKPTKGTIVAIRGDNQASLSWIIDNKARSSLARTAFLAYSWVIIISGFHISTATHVAGASNEMEDIDALSRERSTTNLDSNFFLETSSNERLNDLFRLCDPTRDSSILPDLLSDFELVASCISTLFNS